MSRCKYFLSVLKVLLGISIVVLLQACGSTAVKDEYDQATDEQLVGYINQCNSGQYAYCDALGYSYQVGRETVQDYQQAALYFTKACTEGQYLSSCIHLAFLYLEGNGVNQDDNKAEYLLAYTCDREEYLGCYNLGIMYLNETEKYDPNLAFQAFSKACDKGQYQNACYELAYLTYEGQGTAPNQPKALDLFRNSCEQGHKESCMAYKQLQL